MKKTKKKRVKFTGIAKVEEVDDIEDLAVDDVKKYLEAQNLIKKDTTNWQWQPLDSTIVCKKSLYLFERTTPFRRFCYNLQKHKLFDNFIMFLIFLSSMKLATDTYMTEDDYDKDHMLIVVSEYVNSFFTWAFFGESMIKIIALGFIMDG